MFEKTSGIIIDKSCENYDFIISNLTRSINQFTGGSKEVQFYEELEDGKILIPRFYPLNDEVIDNTEIGKDIEIETHIKPRNKAQEEAMDWFLKNKSGVLQLEPGRGKTVITIHTIAKLKKKSIIITHKTSLLENWKDEFLKYTDLKEEDIVILNSNKSKKYKKKLDNAKIIISTPHIFFIANSKNKKEFFEYINNSGIGIAVFDECHVGVGPEQFSKSSIFLNSSRVYGLSATPKRFDGNEDIIHYHLGPLKYIAPNEDEILKPKIIAFKKNFKINDEFKFYINYGDVFSYTRYYLKAKDSPSYMNLINNITLDSYKRNYNILVLGYRVTTLIEMAKLTKLPKTEIGIFIPSAKPKDILKVSDTVDLKEAFHTKRIVYSTYGAARDGNNRPSLDCLIMTLPTSNIEQAIGRIQRNLPNKRRPLVFDIVDTGGPVEIERGTNEKKSIFEIQYNRRKIMYEEKGWELLEKKIK